MSELGCTGWDGDGVGRCDAGGWVEDMQCGTGEPFLEATATVALNCQQGYPRKDEEKGLPYGQHYHPQTGWSIWVWHQQGFELRHRDRRRERKFDRDASSQRRTQIPQRPQITQRPVGRKIRKCVF